MKKTLFFLMVLSLAWMANAQEDVNSLPYSYTHKDVSYSIDEITMPAVDRKALLTEDAQNIKNGTPMRIGILHQVGYTFENCGRTDILPNGAKLWRLGIKSEGAVSMAVYFSQFNIPEGATLHIYNGKRSQLTGTYTNADIQQNGILVSDDIDDDEIVIEYYEPADVLYHGSIYIDRISHRYRDINKIAMTDEEKAVSGGCHFNTACPEGNGWRDQINSVVRIEITSGGASYLCSGAMINNTRFDKTLYVLSANHCINNDMSSTFKFYFKYETTACDVDDYGFANQKVTGGSIIATDNINYSSDFLLLKITGDMRRVTTDSIFFAGWDVSGASSVGMAIHHPAGDFKKLSIPKSVSSNYYSNYWTVSWYTYTVKGCTEQGSSGSPLFNANKLIIGDLSNGSSACDQLWGTDNYGKISYSWTNGNNSNNAKKLKPWLDPDNTGVTWIPGMRYDGTVVGVSQHDADIRTFNILPNPTSGSILIQGNFDAEEGICNVYNMLGAKIGSYNVNLDPSFSMNFNDLPNGIYVVEILGGTHTYKSKMVITR